MIIYNNNGYITLAHTPNNGLLTQPHYRVLVAYWDIGC